MFSAIEKLGLKEFLKTETVPLIVAWIIAEVFFKFGSFTLECILFLTTWLVAGKLFASLSKVLKR